MDYSNALAEQVSRYSDAELAEAREMMGRWSDTRDMPDVVHSLIHVLDVEHAFRRAEDSAQQAEAREMMARWSETRDMPDVVHSLIHVLDVEHAFRRAEDSAQQAAAAEVAP